LGVDTVVKKPNVDTGSLDSDIAFIQFSSGTTGIKKGVKIRANAIFSQLDIYGKTLDINSNSDCIVNWLPLYHDMGFFTSINLALAFEVHAVLLDPIDWVTNPVSYLQAVSNYKGTLSWHPNFAFSFMAQRIREEDLRSIDLSSLRYLINCSE